MSTELDIRILSTQEEKEVEQRFIELNNSGYIPIGLEDIFFRRMLLAKAAEIAARTFRS